MKRKAKASGRRTFERVTEESEGSSSDSDEKGHLQQELISASEKTLRDLVRGDEDLCRSLLQSGKKMEVLQKTVDDGILETRIMATTTIQHVLDVVNSGGGSTEQRMLR